MKRKNYIGALKRENKYFEKVNMFYNRVE